MTLVDSQASRVELLGRTAGHVNYITANAHRSGLAAYREVRYRDAWPGVDVRFVGDKERLVPIGRGAIGAVASVKTVAFGELGDDEVDLDVAVLGDRVDLRSVAPVLVAGGGEEKEWAGRGRLRSNG